MKYIYSFVFCMTILFAVLQNSYAVCNIDPENISSVGSELNNCLNPDALVRVPTGNDTKFGTGTSEFLIELVNRAGGVLSMLAVILIAYGGFMMVTSAGQEEKTKKAKDLIKWTLLGFLALVTTGGIIRIIIYLVYELSGVQG